MIYFLRSCQYACLACVVPCVVLTAPLGLEWSAALSLNCKDDKKSGDRSVGGDGEGGPEKTVNVPLKLQVPHADPRQAKPQEWIVSDLYQVGRGEYTDFC
jgi:hypothetical protein